MSSEALLYYKKAGVAEESNWAQGTVTPSTKLIALREQGIIIMNKNTKISPVRIGGRASKQSSRLGVFQPKFTLPAFMYPTGDLLKYLKVAFGQVTDTEVASFVVSAGVNDTLDMTEDGGGAFAITLTPGTYKPGATHSDAGTMCALLKTLIEAGNGAATYTVSYSQTTNKFTITKNSGVFVIKFLTGTNTAKNAASLLGFTVADTASAIAATSNSTVKSVWDHVFQPLDAIPYGLSAGLTAQFALAQGPLVYDVLDCVVEMLKFGYKPNQELWLDVECEARKTQVSGSTLSGLTEESSLPLLFSQLVFSVAGGTQAIEGLDISFSNNYNKGMFVNSAYRSRFLRNGTRDVKGSFTLDLADSAAYTIYTAMLAGTQPELIATFTAASGSIKTVASTNFQHTITIDLPKVDYDHDAVPGGGGAAAPKAIIPFVALDDGTNGELKITVRNEAATI